MQRVTVVLLTVAFVVGCHKKPVVDGHADARAERQRTITAVAPAPLPTALPLVGPEGVDADGYPLKAVDRAALRSLLYHRDFDALTSYMEKLQADFEVDPKKEYWPFDAAGAFDTAEPELREPLDAWVAAKPSSAAPLVARGTYFTAVGFARRGADWAKNTSNADFDAMKDAFAPARLDLERALSMKPRAFPASRCLVQLEAASSDSAAARRAADMATSQCPSCFQIRVTYLQNSTPRWSGTYDAMTAYAAAAPKATNPRLRLLEGYVAYDRADVMLRAKDYDGALVEIGKATALGEHWQFLSRRARIERLQQKLDARNEISTARSRSGPGCPPRSSIAQRSASSGETGRPKGTTSSMECGSKQRIRWRGPSSPMP